MSRNDLTWIAIFLLCGALGLFSFLHFYDAAFPTASLDFKLSREEVKTKAEEYLRSFGYDLSGYKSAMVLDNDYYSQIFLEQKLDLREANRLIREEISVWYWHARWFKPLKKEEFRVQVDPRGRVVGFRHTILESEGAGHLEEDEALAMAEHFLKERQGMDLAAYELIERSDVKRDKRTDHFFTYKKKSFTVGEEGTYRTGVTVQGDEVGQFREYLKVPEAFVRKYQGIRSQAGLLGIGANFLRVLFGIALFVVFIFKFRDRALRWRAVVILSLFVLVAFILAAVNSVPLMKFGYVTTESYTYFLLQVVIFAVLIAIVYGALICLSGATGGALRREFAPERPVLRKWSLSRLFSVPFVRSSLIGYGLAFFHLGYVVVFYIFGKQYLGVWAPVESEYQNTFSTAIPWIYALLIGLVASTSEELFFRLFMISFLKKYLKKTWIAVLIPAIIWAFLHVSYPVHPIYIRGLELTVVGVIFGMVFLRFGIWTTVISPYVYNAFLVAYPMLKSTSLYFEISGALVVGIIFLPVLPVLFSALTRRYRQVPEEIEEGEIEKEVSVEVKPEERGHPVDTTETAPTIEKGPEDYFLTPGQMRGVAIAGLVGLALVLSTHVRKFGEHTLQLKISKQEADRIAASLLEKIGLDAEGYVRSTNFRDRLGAVSYTYLLRQVGLEQADSLALRETYPWTWRVRWFKSLQKEEIQVAVSASGDVAGFRHMLPEDREGANISKEEAWGIAEDFVKVHFHREVTDTLQYTRQEASSEKREGRTDHFFTWERTGIENHEGKFRVHATVQGDRVDQVDFYLKAPEHFIRKLEERKAKDVASSVGIGIIVLATVALGVMAFLKQFRSQGIPWRLPLILGGIVTFLVLLSWLNGLSVLFSRYNTAIPWSAFLGDQVLTRLITVVVAFATFTAVSALADGLFRNLYPEEMTLGRWLRLLNPRNGPTRLYLDGLVLAISLLLLSLGLRSLTAFIHHTTLLPYLRTEALSLTGSINTYLPALSGITEIQRYLWILFLGFSAFLVWKRYVKRNGALLALFLVWITLGSAVGPAEDLKHFAALAVTSLFTAFVVLVLVVKVLRFHILSYLFALWIGVLVSGGWKLASTEVLFYQANGWAMIALGLLPFLYLALAMRKK